eukprot:TRINITY_DN134_c2_g1_i1.p2 TRINITY_DN134_c2_g1~~TRINITY_DN134_c2_g1_i1.p2  ORF type:complete len:151 (+),score=8.41 TRINITY_DN134_c2_g1_i1:282-734(+)
MFRCRKANKGFLLNVTTRVVDDVFYAYFSIVTKNFCCSLPVIVLGSKYCFHSLSYEEFFVVGDVEINQVLFLQTGKSQKSPPIFTWTTRQIINYFSEAFQVENFRKNIINICCFKQLRNLIFQKLILLLKQNVLIQKLVDIQFNIQFQLF